MYRTHGVSMYMYILVGCPLVLSCARVIIPCMILGESGGVYHGQPFTAASVQGLHLLSEV